MDAAGVTPAGLAATRGVSHGTLSVLACLWWAHRMLWPKQPAESAVVLWCSGWANQSEAAAIGVG